MEWLSNGVKDLSSSLDALFHIHRPCVRKFKFVQDHRKSTAGWERL